MPRKRNPEAARIEADYKSKKRSIDSQVKSASKSAPATKKSSATAATRKIKGGLKSGKVKRLIQPDVIGNASNYLHKTSQGAHQSAFLGSNAVEAGEESYNPKTGKTKKAGSAAKSQAKAKSAQKSPFAKLMKDGGSGKLAKSRKKKRKAPTYRG